MYFSTKNSLAVRDSDDKVKILTNFRQQTEMEGTYFVLKGEIVISLFYRKMSQTYC